MSVEHSDPTSGEGFRAMDRRKFLKLGGAGLAGVVFFVAPGSGEALARRNSSLEEEFRAAAKHYSIPTVLLKAMGYVNTHWEMPPPETSDYQAGEMHGWGGYGIMHLVRNPWSDTLGEASRLTGIPVEKLKTDRAANVMGGAALLSSSQGKSEPAGLDDWFGAVAGEGGNGRTYEAPSGVGGREIYADQVFDTLRRGASKQIKSGERASLKAVGVTR